MDELIHKVVVVVAVIVGIVIATALTKRRNQALAPGIERALRERGPQTLPELATAMGMGSFFARGKVAMALNDLLLAGKVELIAAPEGTPQLAKVNHVRYRWREG